MAVEEKEVKIRPFSLKTHRNKLVKKFGKETVLVDKELEALAAMPYGVGGQSNMINLVIGRPGFPAGRLTEIVGQEASSKSTLGYHILAECQRLDGIGILIETEEAFETSRLKKLGIKVDELIICQPRHMEEAFSMMEMNIKEIRAAGHKGPIVIVWDSIASTPALAETESEFDDDTMAAAARFLSKAMRKFVRTVASHKVVLIFMNQLKATLDPYSGEKYVSYGGKAIKFHASIRLWVKTKKSELEFDKTKGTNEPLGTIVNVQNIKNKISTPFKITKYFLNFKKGIDQYRDCREFGVATKIFKEIGKGRVVVKDKSYDKKHWKKFVKSRWGSAAKCRDYLIKKAMKRKLIKPYGEVEEVSVKKKKKGKRPRDD